MFSTIFLLVSAVIILKMSCVILYEISGEYAKSYLSLLLKEALVTTDEMKKAVHIMALCRINDHDNEKVRKLIREGLPF